MRIFFHKVWWILFFWIFPLSVKAQEFFFDAQQTRILKDGTAQEFVGDVVVVGPSILISADRMRAEGNEVSASGSVLLLTSESLFTAKRITFFLERGTFKAEDARMVSNFEPDDSEVFSNYLARQQTSSKEGFLNNLQERRKGLVRLFAAKSDADKRRDYEKFVDRYLQILEREDAIAQSQDLDLAHLPLEARKRVQERRAFWARYQEGATGFLGDLYFELRAKSLEKVSRTHFVAEDLDWTPCECENEAPSWSVGAEKLDLQVEGYARFKNPMLKIKGVPVLYMPFFIIPVKSERQSGFLFPRYYTSEETGSVYSQSLFLVHSPQADSTIGIDMFETRGTKLNLEYRHHLSQHSRFQMNAEVMKDYVWMQKMKQRQLAYDQKIIGEGQHILQCQEIADPEEREVCQSSKSLALEWPSNTWRYRYQFEGLYLFDYRTSFASRVMYSSDHRYDDDLRLQDTLSIIREDLSSDLNQQVYETSRLALNHRFSKIHLFLGSHWGDSLITRKSFSGYQLPLNFRAATRPFSLDLFSLPVFFQMNYEMLKIEAFRSEPVSLRPVLWNEWNIEQHASLIKNRFLNLHQSLTHTFRLIEPDNSGMRETSLQDDSEKAVNHLYQSTRLDFDLNLPIYAELPFDWLDDPLQRKSLIHTIDFRAVMSIRPYVVRSQDQDEIYFQTDSELTTPTTSSVLDRTDFSMPYRVLKLAIDQRWNLRTKELSINEGTNREKAEKIFDHLLQEKPMESGATSEVAYLNTEIDYGFLNHSEETNPIQSQALGDLKNKFGLGLSIFRLEYENRFNFFLKRSLENKGSLAVVFPRNQSIKFSYAASVLPTFDQNLGTISLSEIEEMSFFTEVEFWKSLRFSTWLGRRLNHPGERGYIFDNQTVFALAYLDSSNCWRLDFKRQRLYGVEEAGAEYLLALSVILGPSQHQLGNFGPSVKNKF